MEYNKQLALSPTSETMLPVPELVVKVCPHCQARLSEPAESIPPPRKPKNKRLWVDAIQYRVKFINLAKFIQVVMVSSKLSRSLKKLDVNSAIQLFCNLNVEPFSS